ncbi:MAG: hypothetical protein JXN61_10495 [Sedimentisphaerales bacterium]|nr:hypothetical protein [Sedimentisphaerales bacterium]
MQNKPIGYIVWLAVMCLVAVSITVALFLVLVPLASRGYPFYFAISVLCAAELVCFAWLVNYRLSTFYEIRISGATQITIHVLIGVYFMVTVIFALVLAPSPSESKGVFNAVTLVYAASVFALLLAASMLYAKDIGLVAERAEIQAQSRPLRLLEVDVEQICMTLRDSARKNSGEVAAVERVVKKIEGLRTSLQYAPGKKPGTLEEDERNIEAINNKISSRLEALTQSIADMSGPEGFARKLGAVDSTVNEIEMLLKQRQQRLLV